MIQQKKHLISLIWTSCMKMQKRLVLMKNILISFSI